MEPQNNSIRASSAGRQLTNGVLTRRHCQTRKPRAPAESGPIRDTLETADRDSSDRSGPEKISAASDSTTGNPEGDSIGSGNVLDITG